MTKLFPILATFTISAAILAAAPEAEPQTSTAKAWTILEQGLSSKRAAKRASATGALRLLPHNPRAQEMAARAITDPDPTVRAAAARTLGSMEAVSSVPRLKTALNDKEPAVVLAAAHALFLLGERQEAFSVDYAVLTGERKTRDGFVKSQINTMKSEMSAARDDPKAAALRSGIRFAPVPGAGELYGAFKEIKKNDPMGIRAAAAEELAEDHDPEVDAALARACSDKDWTIRASAVSAIAKRDNPALLSAITPALEDKNDVVRYEAAAALLRLYAAVEKDGGSDSAADGTGEVRQSRMYQLVRQKGVIKEGTFEIEFLDPGVEAFSFTFG